MATKIKSNKELGKAIKGTIFNDTELFEMWFAENWKKATIVAVAVAVLISVIFGIVKYQRISAQKAASAFANADTIEKLESALKTYDGKKGAALARFRLAGLYISAAEFAKYKDTKSCDAAQKALTMVIADSDADSFLVGKARLALAALYENQGNFTKAAAEYEAVLNSKTASIIREEAGYSAARLAFKACNAQKTAQLLNLLDQIPDNGAGSYWKISGKELRLALESGECVKKTQNQPKVQTVKPAVKPAAKK